MLKFTFGAEEFVFQHMHLVLENKLRPQSSC